MNDKEFCNAIHLEIHALRRIPNYKANPAEINISKLVMDKFEKECKECRERKEQLKNTKSEKSFLGKLGGMFDGT